MTLRIGTAAWALPRDVREAFPAGASNLARYAARLTCTEINSSFYRPHRRATYQRWAESVPADFRFAVKLPKAISHEARLVDCEALLARFADESGGLGDKRGPALLQLPPNFAYDAGIATAFFGQFADIMSGPLALEPRHASWFDPAVDAMLAEHRVSRVAADPARVPQAASPGGCRTLTYLRLHGSPQIYRSSYDDATLRSWLDLACAAPGEAWTIFDNTTSGAATRNALTSLDLTPR